MREVDPAVPDRAAPRHGRGVRGIDSPAETSGAAVGRFAGLALLLAAVGTYGVLSYMVTERRREIGVRMALGASRSSVIGLVMKQGLQATVIGVIVGACRRALPQTG